MHDDSQTLVSEDKDCSFAYCSDLPEDKQGLQIGTGIGNYTSGLSTLPPYHLQWNTSFQTRPSPCTRDRVVIGDS